MSRICKQNKKKRKRKNGGYYLHTIGVDLIIR